jgi:glycosidase
VGVVPLLYRGIEGIEIRVQDRGFVHEIEHMFVLPRSRRKHYFPPVRRVISAIALMAIIASACSGTDPLETTTTEVPTTQAITTTTLPANVGPVAAPIRHPATDGSIYFVMTDRFENGDPTNDTGGLEGGPLDHGFLPEDKGFYQGGDLVGLTARLPYIAELGMTAIWITPPFTNRPVQGGGQVDNSSAGYHGYWQIDWSQIDPHLGTEEEMQAFLAEANSLGIDVYFDIVINHTGDVITYEEGNFAYQSKRVAPYQDASGNVFDDAALAGDETAFPALDPIVTFPYTPAFVNPEDATIKSPDWLDDPTVYHNRGDSIFQGESSYYGDFFGLDDLFTEDPRVVEGMIELYTDIIARYDIAGFRVDTVKHVNDEFWVEWMPPVLESAPEDFFVFGEVFSAEPIFNSHYTTNLGFPGLLDFTSQNAFEQYVANGAGADVLSGAFDNDDWFTDADSNASMLVKFFGNHDMGRMGRMVLAGNPNAPPEEVEESMRLGFDLLFLTRGMPVVYYGDEQGFAGLGGDKSARQTMFPATATEFVDQETIGSEATVSDDNFDPQHPLYQHIAMLNQLRMDHPTLATGAQIVHPPAASVFSFSRIDRDDRIEYLVVVNNGPLAIPATIPALSAGTGFTFLLGGEGSVTSDGAGRVELELGARSTAVLVAGEPLSIPEEEPTINIVRPDPNDVIPTVRYRIEAQLGDSRYAEVTFALVIDRADPIILGTDDAAPYRLYWNNQAVPSGTSVEILATVDDGSGRLRSDSVTITMGDRF